MRKPQNKGLPQRWSIRHGAYYYEPPESVRHLWDGKSLFRLGKTLSEAHAKFAEMVGVHDRNIHTIGHLLDRYLIEVVPTFKPTTQQSEKTYIKKLRSVFGDVPVTSLEPQHVYKYFDTRKAKTSARNEVGVLSNAFSNAVKWGVIKKHPFKGEVTLKGAKKPRDRYVTDDEIKTCLKFEGRAKSIKVVQAYIELKLLIGCRKADILRIKMSDIDTHLNVFTSKSEKPMAFELTPALTEAIEKAKSLRPVLSPYLFCTHRGECMVTESGRTGAFDYIWREFLAKVGVAHFTEHDLRRKAGSDQVTLERASELLGHSDIKVTKRHYRAKAQIVKPSK